MQAQQAAEADLQLMTANFTEQQQSLSAQHAQHAQQAQQLANQVQQLEASCASLAGQKAAAEQSSVAAMTRAGEQGTLLLAFMPCFVPCFCALLCVLLWCLVFVPCFVLTCC